MDWFEQHLNWTLAGAYFCAVVLIFLSALAAFTYDGIKDQTTIMVIDLAVTWALGLYFFFYATRWYLGKRKKSH